MVTGRAALQRKSALVIAMTSLEGERSGGVKYIVHLVRLLGTRRLQPSKGLIQQIT
jgi:hypothetical protein